MQNTKASKGVTSSTIETKRPNILRKNKRATCETNIRESNLTNQTNNHLPSIDLHLDSSITPSSFTSDCNESYCLLSSDIFDGSLNDFLSYPQSNCNKKIHKTTPRKRRGPQRIILDTYVCDKNRLNSLNQQVETKKPIVKSQNIVESVALSDVLNSDGHGKEDFSSAVLLDDVHDDMENLGPESPYGLSQEVVCGTTTGMDGQEDALLLDGLIPSVSDQLAEGIQLDLDGPQQNTSQTNTSDGQFLVENGGLQVNGVSSVQSLVLDPGLECEAAVEALKVAGLYEEQHLVVEAMDGSHKSLWLCPLSQCNILYTKKELLLKHILGHYNINTFSCAKENCDKVYISQGKLSQHWTECHPETPTTTVTHVETGDPKRTPAEEAPSERTPAESWENLRLRAKSLVAEALATVGFSEDLIKSKVADDGTRCWPCPQQDCHLSFKTLYLLKNHILEHYDLRPFKCTHSGCGWNFRSLGRLRVHWDVHAGVRRHVCSHPGCRKAYISKYNLSVHAARAHTMGGDTPRNTHTTCPACPRTFQHRQDLEVHLNTQHQPHQAPNRCGTCGARFWWSKCLAMHAKSHNTPPEKLICAWPECGRKFFQPSRLRYHLRSHTGDKPYRCTHPSCNWAFPSASKLRRHARAHAGAAERRHACPACGRCFLRPEHLREHLPRHNLPHRHYACDHPGCEEKFSNKSSVYTHKKRQHSGDKERKPPRTRRVGKGKVPLEESPVFPIIPLSDVCLEDSLSLRSARTHVPWTPISTGSLMPPPSDIMHLTSCEEKQGNPLVCGGLDLESGDAEGEMVGGVVGAELCLGEGEGDNDVGVGVGVGVGGTEGDLSLLLQEELSDGILYATEEETALQVLLLSEAP